MFGHVFCNKFYNNSEVIKARDKLESLSVHLWLSADDDVSFTDRVFVKCSADYASNMSPNQKCLEMF